MSCASTAPKDVDLYIATAPDFARPILHAIRQLIRQTAPDLQETIKWRCPCYQRHALVCSFAAFQQHVSLTFFRGASLPSATSLLQHGTDNAAIRTAKFRAVEEIPTPSLRKLLQEALDVDAAPSECRSPGLRRPEPTPPPELTAALRQNAAAHAAFKLLPPSCRREYIQYIAEAKQPETRTRRLDRTLQMLAEGRRLNDKYRTGPRRPSR